MKIFVLNDSVNKRWGIGEYMDDDAIRVVDRFWNQNEEKVRKVYASLIDFFSEPVHPVDTQEVVTEPPKRIYKISAEARARMAAAQRRRWAGHHKVEANEPVPTVEIALGFKGE